MAILLAVSFYPDDTANDELKIGLPLNKLAEKRQKASGLTSNVENTIKPDADLSEAIRMGLERCKQTEKRLEDFRAKNSQ